MIFTFFTLICVAICFIKGYWRRWKDYYPTMLYFFIGDTVSDVLLRVKPLWAYCGLLFRYPVLDIALTAVLYPTTVLVFLSLYPAEGRRKIPYILLCVAVFTAVEFVASQLGDFLYFNGWNIGYSLIFNMAMFPMLLLHHKKPLLTWPVSSALAAVFLWLLKIPLAR